MLDAFGQSQTGQKKNHTSIEKTDSVTSGRIFDIASLRGVPFRIQPDVRCQKPTQAQCYHSTFAQRIHTLDPYCPMLRQAQFNEKGLRDQSPAKGNATHFARPFFILLSGRFLRFPGDPG